MSEVQGVVRSLRMTHGPADPAVWKALFRRTRGTRPGPGWRCVSCPEEVVLWDGDRPVSFMGMLTRQVTLNSVLTDVGGLGYGATAPDWEHRGCLRRVVSHALDVFYSYDLDWALLTCLDALVPFYRDKLGWMQVGCEVGRGPGLPPIPPEVAVMAYWLGYGVEPTITQLDLEGLPW